MNIYFVMIIGGFAGIILHSFKAVRDIATRTAGITFSDALKEYWKTEYLSLVSSLFCFCVLLFVASEFINLNRIDTPDYKDSIPDRLLHFRISNFIKLSSVIAGYMSDSLVYSFLGRTEKKLLKEINKGDDNSQG